MWLGLNKNVAVMCPHGLWDSSRIDPGLKRNGGDWKQIWSDINMSCNLSIVPIPWSHVIARSRFIRHFKLWPDPIVKTVIDSYLHHHWLSWAPIWWRSRPVSWLQVAVIGWAGNQAQPEIFESQDTISNSAQFHHCMLNNSTTTAPIHILVRQHSPGPCPSMAVLLESKVAT